MALVPEDDFADMIRIPPGRHRLSRSFVARHQRARLFAAIVQLVAEKGYPATSLTEIVKTAGVARHTFYEHFAGKDELFVEVFDETADRIFQAMLEAAEVAGDQWEDRLRAGLTTLVEMLAEEPELARVCVIDVLSAGPLAIEHYEAALRRFASLLRLGREAVPRGAELPDSLEDIIVGGILWMLDNQLLRSRNGHKPDDVLRGVLEFALTPYVGEAAAKRAAAQLDD